LPARAGFGEGEERALVAALGEFDALALLIRAGLAEKFRFLGG
jgi:hypothetical protein